MTTSSKTTCSLSSTCPAGRITEMMEWIKAPTFPRKHLTDSVTIVKTVTESQELLAPERQNLRGLFSPLNAKFPEGGNHMWPSPSLHSLQGITGSEECGKCPSKDQHISHLWKMLTVAYHPALKMKEPVTHTMTRMNPENIVLSEKSQTQKATWCVFWMWSIRNRGSPRWH